MHGSVRRNKAEAQLGQRPLRVDEHDRALLVTDVVREVAGHDRALAASLAADERVSVLAISGRDRDGTALVPEQDPPCVALDRRRRDRAPDGRAREACMFHARARELPEGGQLRCGEDSSSRDPGIGLGSAAAIRLAYRPRRR